MKWILFSVFHDSLQFRVWKTRFYLTFLWGKSRILLGLLFLKKCQLLTFWRGDLNSRRVISYNSFGWQKFESSNHHYRWCYLCIGLFEHKLCRVASRSRCSAFAYLQWLKNYATASFSYGDMHFVQPFFSWQGRLWRRTFLQGSSLLYNISCVSSGWLNHHFEIAWCADFGVNPRLLPWLQQIFKVAALRHLHGSTYCLIWCSLWLQAMNIPTLYEWSYSDSPLELPPARHLHYLV